MKKILTALICATICSVTAQAQNTFPASGSAGIGTITPNANAALEIASTTQGFLPPRMTLTQRNTIAATAPAGLMIYQTTNSPGFYYYTGSAWKALAPAGVNKFLSNLSAPTAVNVSLIPGANNASDLGSSALRWKFAYVSNVNFGDGSLQNTAFVPYTAGTGIGITGTTISAQNTTAWWNAGQIMNVNVSNTTPADQQVLKLVVGKWTPAADIDTQKLSLNTSNVLSISNGNSVNIPAGWLLIGNSGTNPAGNFIGTKDAQALAFRVNNQKAGLIDWNAAMANAVFGYQALNLNVNTGSGNSAYGYKSSYSNTTGSYNTGIGDSVLYSNTTGNSNTAIGRLSLYSNTTGYSNVAIGTSSLFSNTDHSNLVAIGDSALYHNGIGAVYPDYGGGNTAIGSKTLYSNTTGSGNTANGSSALYNNSTGDGNTANGERALYNNTEGDYNTATGETALFDNTLGIRNTANGASALDNNSIGIENTAVGNSALGLNYTGNGNTAVGDIALNFSYTGSYNTALGHSADVTDNNLTNATAIGWLAIVNASNKVVIGNTAAGIVIGGYANWSNLSDGRFKENIKEDVPGLKFITKLRPVTYTINTKKLDEHVMQNMPDSIKAKRRQSAQAYAKAALKIQTGFVAQEVEKTAKEIGYNFDGVNAPQNPTDNYSIAYSQFVVPLVKAVQELSQQNDDLKKTNEQQQTINKNLQQQIDELKKLIQPTTIATQKDNMQTVVLAGAASLEQNIPNPFTNSTTINYYLPVNDGNAYINFYDVNGKTLKSVKLNGTGKGSIEVKAVELPSGTYRYALVRGNVIVATKQMILAR